MMMSVSAGLSLTAGCSSSQPRLGSRAARGGHNGTRAERAGAGFIPRDLAGTIRWPPRASIADDLGLRRNCALPVRPSIGALATRCNNVPHDNAGYGMDRLGEAALCTELALALVMVVTVLILVRVVVRCVRLYDVLVLLFRDILSVLPWASNDVKVEILAFDQKKPKSPVVVDDKGDTTSRE